MKINELTNEFMKNYADKRLRPTTLRGYRTNIDKHILPYIGQKRINELLPDDLDDLTETLQEKGLKNKTIIYVHATLRKAYNYAIKRGYISGNPYSRYDLPRVDTFRYTILPEDQMIRMLDAADGWDDIDLAIRLALRYGLRRGEILGIRPETDLDYLNNTLHIQRTRTVENGQEVVTPCKTKNSDRYILLFDEDAAHLDTRTGYAVPLTPPQLDFRFRQFLAQHQFSPMRFHDLRHTYATYMLSKGVNPKIVSSVLGHSGIAITLNIYSHPDVSMQRSCLEVLP